MPSRENPGPVWRMLNVLRPSHEHSAFSATVLMMTAMMLSRVIGYVREAYIAYAFGAGRSVDAYVAAFTLPDWLNYLIAGGTASVTFITILTRARAEGREREAQKTFNVILSVMTAVLVVGIVIAEIFTPQFTRLMFPKFTPEQQQLCVFLTRILLPAQLFFYTGGVVSAVMLAERRFALPALGPLLYNFFIIVGGVLLGPWLGVASLAVGALAGSFAGPFLVNAIGAARAGAGFRLDFDFRDPEFLHWVRLTLPLMIGVSVVTADDWILRFFASGGAGDIARLNYAKRLFAVPIAVLGQATGQASLPFFARLFSERRLADFNRTVNDAVYRIAALSLLASAGMIATALPLVDLVYRRGLFTAADAHVTAAFFLWFSLSLVFWAAQALYARAFYAAGSTLAPMVAGSAVTLLSLPVYSGMFQSYGVVGLAIASDIAIVAHTVVLAALLHHRNLVTAGVMRWGELAKALAVAVAAGTAAYFAALRIQAGSSYGADALAIGVAGAVWAAVTVVGLWATRSQLPGALRRRRAQAGSPPLVTASDLAQGNEP